ncbi:unnamed protein product, partial [Ixodes persulcatus]
RVGVWGGGREEEHCHNSHKARVCAVVGPVGRSEAGCHTARGGAGKGRGCRWQGQQLFLLCALQRRRHFHVAQQNKGRGGRGAIFPRVLLSLFFFLHSTDIEEVLLLPREKPRCDLSLVQASLAATQPCSPGLKQFRRERGGGSSVARLS